MASWGSPASPEVFPAQNSLPKAAKAIPPDSRKIPFTYPLPGWGKKAQEFNLCDTADFPL